MRYLFVLLILSGCAKPWSLEDCAAVLNRGEPTPMEFLEWSTHCRQWVRTRPRSQTIRVRSYDIGNTRIYEINP